MKRLSTESYQALRNALAVVTWYKRSFESLVRTALREHPELLAGLNFDDLKRRVADEVVARLVAQEDRYQKLSIQLMLEIAAMKTFPDIEAMKEPDRSARLSEARSAVETLIQVTKRFSINQAEQERVRAAQEARRMQEAVLRQFSDDLASLHQKFLSMHGSENPQQRGRDFEKLLYNLFNLFDMEPRLAYNLETEQIDGALSFDTDDYLLEAKWLSIPVSRAELDAFAAKVGRKGKNALGLFIAVQGFSSPALETYSTSTPFIAIDGADLYLVLEGRVRLDDLLKAKRRYAHETGSCYLRASDTI